MTGTRYAWDFSFLWGYRGLILTGLGVTIAYTIGTILLGLVVGLVPGLLRLSKNVLIMAPLVAYVEVFRCTPNAARWSSSSGRAAKARAFGLSHCFHRLTAAFRQPANSVLDGKIVVKIAFGPFANRLRLR